MEELNSYLSSEIEKIKEAYDYYLEKLDNAYNPVEKETLLNRLRDLRIEKNTLEKIKDVLNGEE